MMFQSKAVTEILLGLDSGWPSTDRDDEGLPLKTAFQASWWMVIAGAILLFLTFFYAFELFFWVCPIAIPMLIAPLFISMTGDPALGDAVRRSSLFATPFELDPEPVIRASEKWRRRLTEESTGRSAQAPKDPAPSPANPTLATA